MKKLAWLIFLFSLMLPTVYGNVKLVEAKKMIPDLDKILAAAKKEAPMRLVFPEVLPDNENKLPRYFMSSQRLPSGAYRLNINSTAECKGEKYCNLGFLEATSGGNPEINYDMNNREITVPVQLSNHLKGYYTPGHPLGDYFPATLSWRDKDVLYRLSWDLPEKQQMLDMVNSAK